MNRAKIYTQLLSTAISAKRRGVRLCRFAASAACVLICACSSTAELPSVDNSTAEKNARKAEAKKSTMTLSQKRILDIYTMQTKFLERIRSNGRFSSSDTVSEKRKIDSLWSEYLLEHPNDVDALVLCAKFHRACGDNDAAYATFRVADKLDGNLAVVKQQLACYEAECSLGIEAYDHILEAVKIAPNVPVYNMQAAQTILFFRDRIAEAKGMKREEIDAQMLNFYARAAELLPSDKTAQWKYAQAFYDVKGADWNKALAQWEVVLKNCVALNIDRQTALANKARVLVELNRDAEAEAILNGIDNPNLADSKSALLHVINGAKKGSSDAEKPEKTSDVPASALPQKKNYQY